MAKVFRITWGHMRSEGPVKLGHDPWESADHEEALRKRCIHLNETSPTLWHEVEFMEMPEEPKEIKEIKETEEELIKKRIIKINSMVGERSEEQRIEGLQSMIQMEKDYYEKPNAQ